MADHELVVTFDGDTEYVGLRCNLSGADRPCAVIVCSVDHEDVDRGCIEAHGAVAVNECWAVSYVDAGGRETLDADGVGPVVVPVDVYWDEGVVANTPERVKVEASESAVRAENARLRTALDQLAVFAPKHDRIPFVLIDMQDIARAALESEGQYG